MLRFIENSIVICIGFGILIFGFLPIISGVTTTGLDAILNFQNSEYGESLIWLLVPATGLTMLAIIHWYRLNTTIKWCVLLLFSILMAIPYLQLFFQIENILAEINKTAVQQVYSSEYLTSGFYLATLIVASLIVMSVIGTISTALGTTVASTHKEATLEPALT